MTSVAVVLDAVDNRWRVADGPWQVFAHRYEAMVLRWLQQHPHEPLTLEGLQALVQQHGQARPLNRAQIQRLVDSINQAGLVAGERGGKPSSTPLWGVRHAHRQKTVGPWSLSSRRGVVWQQSVLPEAAGPVPERVPDHSPPPLAAEPLDWLEWVRVLQQLLSADAHALHGRNEQARQALDGVEPRWGSVQLLVQSRLVRVLIRQGQYVAAQLALKGLTDLARGEPWGVLWHGLLGVLQERLSYNQRAANLTGPELDASLAALQGTLVPWPGLWSPERFNLMGQLHRRRAMLAQTPELRRHDLEAAHQHLNGALMLALAHENYQQVQAYAYNLSLVAELDGQPLAQLHLLAYADRCSRETGVGEESQWALVSLAELVVKLSQQGGVLPAKLVFPGLPAPHLATFWLALVSRVEKVQNPRELAHALHLAQGWFARSGNMGVAQNMQARLDALLAQHPGLRTLLLRDLQG